MNSRTPSGVRRVLVHPSGVRRVLTHPSGADRALVNLSGAMRAPGHLSITNRMPWRPRKPSSHQQASRPTIHQNSQSASKQTNEPTPYRRPASRPIRDGPAGSRMPTEQKSERSRPPAIRRCAARGSVEARSTRARHQHVGTSSLTRLAGANHALHLTARERNGGVVAIA